MKLYDYFRSSAAYRVRIALNLKNLPYEQVSVRLVEREQLAEDYLAKNPLGVVPTLVHNDQPVIESSIRQDIGGDVQTISSVDTRWADGRRNDELVTAEAGDRCVGLPECSEEPLRCCREQGIARAVAVDVVDQLEAVEIGHEHCDLGPSVTRE